MRLEIEPNQPLIPQTDAVTETHIGTIVDAEVQLREGIKAAQSGDRTRARTFLLNAVDADPQSERAWLWLASISEYPEELHAFLENVLEINPENERALEWYAATRKLMSCNFLQRAVEAADVGRLDVVSQNVEKALDYDQHNSKAWLWKATLLVDLEERVEMLKGLYANDPQNSEAEDALNTAKSELVAKRLEQARTAAIAGHVLDASALLDQIIADDPDVEEAWMLRSHLVGSFELKIEAFERVLEVNPDNAAAKAGLDSLISFMESTSDSAAVIVPEVDDPAATDLDGQESVTVVHEFHYEVSSNEAETDGGDFHQDDIDLLPEESAYTYAAEDHSQTRSDDDLTNEPEFETNENIDEEFSGFDVDHNGSGGQEATEKASHEHGSPFSTTSTFVNLHPIEFPNEPITAELYPDVIENMQANSDYAAPNEFDAPYEIEIDHADNYTAEFDPQNAAHSSDPIYEFRPGSCPFCHAANDVQAIQCGECSAVLTLADLEMLLANQRADKSALLRSVDEMERVRQSRELSENELTMLGIAHLNLRNLQYGYNYLLEASKLNPDNVILSSQVNALLIRLEEIREQKAISDTRPKGKTILVVDDSATVRKLIVAKLEKAGHDVFAATDGAEAVEMLENLKPDLVLLDITMPRMDGYQVCRLIRSNEVTKDVPVVMISGKDGFFDKVRGRMAGTTGYITKPFGPETLMKTVDSYLQDVQ